MNCCSKYFSDANEYSSDHVKDISEIKKTAENAFKNICLIYNEIMSPKECDAEDPETVNNNFDVCSSYSSDGPNHYLRSCCNTVKELCDKCDKFISRCSSCNHCNCFVSDYHLNENRCSENSEDIYRSSNVQGSSLKLKCTVPSPFSFYAKNEERQKSKECKISKIKQDRESKIENELKIRANCKPVPKSTYLPLYNQMVQEREQHKLKRKEKCLEILNSTKPFNLHSSLHSSTKTKSLTDLRSENIHFRAKPIPKHILSNEVSEKLKNKEEIRKMLINERAKQTFEKSSLPFSQKTITYSHSLVNMYNLNKAQNKECKQKNVSEITKRLYEKKCNKVMEDWNEKVLQVDTNKKMTNQEKSTLMNECVSIHKRPLPDELPFMYFPVRMSNAAMLRENSIRKEIMARKEREKKTKEEEITKKRVNSDILYKLKNLIHPCEGEKEIDEKVKSFRESQVRRKQEYEKELEEILKRVSEQNLLLERQSKIKKISLSESSYSDKESEDGENDVQESVETNSDGENDAQESDSANSNSGTYTKS